MATESPSALTTRASRALRRLGPVASITSARIVAVIDEYDRVAGPFTPPR
jgi:hypothetical protein